MSTVLVGSFPLGTINVGLNGALTVTAPLLAQVDLMLTGSFGLSGTLADLSAQLNAAISLQASLSIQVSNPFASLKAQLTAIAQIQAGIAATLALGLPAVSVQLSSSLSASAAIAATLSARVGGIQALLEASIAAKAPVVDLMGSIGAALAAGPIVLVSVGIAAPSTLAASGAEYQALTAAPLGGINPGDTVFGIMLLTSSPSAAVAISSIMKTT